MTKLIMTNRAKKTVMSGVILFLLLAGTEQALAQAVGQNPALFKVVYDFTHVEDSKQRDWPINEEVILYMNHNTSLYRRSGEEENEYHGFLATGGSKEDFDLNSILDKTASIFQNISDAQRISTERIVREMYQTSEPLEEIAWEIRDEVREIDGYAVQLATGHFRGRDYEAWFAPDIPFSFGPWKLHGLPGLILEARDSRDDVIFTLKSFGQMEGPPVEIIAPDDIRKVSVAEYKKVYGAFRDNPTAFIQATAPQGTQIRVGVSTQAGTARRERAYNNPLELTNR